MSHSLNVVRIAAVCCAITSCAAIFRRNGDIFFRTNRPSCDSRFSVVGEAVCFPSAGTLIASPTVLLLVLLAASSASAFVRRPSGPVPEIFSGSRCSSSTIRRTAGDRVRAGLAVFASADSSLGGAAACASDFAGAFFSAGLAAGAFFESSMVATTSPIFTS